LPTRGIRVLPYRQGLSSDDVIAFHREAGATVAITCLRSAYEKLRTEQTTLRLAPSVHSVRAAVNSLLLVHGALRSDDAQIALGLVEIAADGESALRREAGSLGGSVIRYDDKRYLVVTTRGPLEQATAAFTELGSDFWFHALWAARKLRRGEVLTALGCLDRLLLSNLVTLLRWHALSLDPSVDTWHGTRFVERWADPGALATLETVVPGYGVRDVARGLWATIDLYQGLEEETARRLGLEVELDHADLRRRISEVVRDPRPGATLWP